jgi:hypothetical protein
MPDQATVVSIDNLLDALVAYQDRQTDLTKEVEKLKARAPELDIKATSTIEDQKLARLECEALHRTGRFALLTIAAWGVFTFQGETLREIFRPPAPRLADFADHFATLVDVRQSGKREQNINQLRTCMKVVERLLPPAASASAPDASASLPPKNKPEQSSDAQKTKITSGSDRSSNEPTEKKDTRVSEGDKLELRSACQSLNY